MVPVQINQEQRLWYIGPMFRHHMSVRKKGRYRQFQAQLGAEVFGLQGRILTRS